MKKFENRFSNLCKNHSIFDQSKHSDMISTFEFFSTNQTAAVSQNQTKNDRIIVIVTKTFETYFRNKKTLNVSPYFIFNANSNNNNSELTDDTRISMKK